jgi:general secretion pathway protein D
LIGLALGGCATFRGYNDAQSAEERGDWDRAVLEYLDLVRRDPPNLRYRASLLRAKIQASHMHFEQAKRYQDASLLGQAMVELQQAVQLDPTNQYARSELEKVREELAAAQEGRKRETLAEVTERTQGSRALPPVLNPRSPEPIDLVFAEPVNVRQIYQAMGTAFGINVLFDQGLRDITMPIELRDVSAQDALEIVMRAAGHFYKVLDEHSIIVVADTPQNRRKYEDLIIQTFFLSNADVKEVMAMLRSLVDSRKIASNEQLNAIIVRDKADVVKIAERIIRANDKAKAEVVVDVELLQLNTSHLQDLGLSLSDYQVGVQLDTGATSGEGEGAGSGTPQIRLNDLRFLDANSWLVTVPSFVVDFLKNSSDAQTLAKPSLRITEGEPGRITIADRVPIPVTSFNTGNTVGGNIVPVTSFQYQDVGIRIEIEPRVHHNEEISLQLMVEVSNLAGAIGDQPIIGTRMIETAIRLKDGETNFLAGLLRTDETNDEEGVPGLSEIPVIGRLFSKKRSQKQRTDIVLTLTPHIIRRADITEEDLVPIWVGTEDNLSFQGGSPRLESEAIGPFDGEDDGSAQSIEELRERLQQLPPGLQPGAPRVGFPGVNQGDPEPIDQQPQSEPQERPSGIDLVPPIQRNPLDRRDDDDGEDDRNLSELRGGFGSGGAAGLLGAGRALVLQATATLAAQAPPARGRRVSVPPAGEIVIGLFPSSQEVEVGQNFEIAVETFGQPPFFHLPFVVRYDTGSIELRDAYGGNAFDRAGEHRILFGHSQPGRALVGASLIGEQQGITRDGSTVRLRFTALRTGNARVEITQVEALDGELTGLRVELGESQVEVAVVEEVEEEPAEPTEEPAATGSRSEGAGSSRRQVEP